MADPLQKNKGPLLTSRFKGIVDVIPLKWRSKLGLTRRVQKVPLDVDIDQPNGSTPDGKLVSSSVEQELTDERKKTNVWLNDVVGSSMVVYIRTKDGQIATRTCTVVDEGTPLPPMSELIIDAEQDAWGNGQVEQCITTVPNVFGANDYVAERPDVIPQEFAALLKVFETGETVPGIASMPTLVTTSTEYDLRREEQQVTEQTKRVTRRYRDISSVPVITDKDTNKEKQPVTIRKTLVADTVTPLLPTPIKDTKFDMLGSGLAVQTEISVDAIFVGAVYSKSIENLIPPKLRAAVPTRTHDFTVQNSAVVPNPTLALGELSHKETQIDEFNKRVESVTIDTVSGVEVADKLVVFEYGGSVATRTATLGTHGSLTVATGPRILKSELTDLNNGWDILETVEADDVTWQELHGQDYDERFDVLIPYSVQTKDANAGLGTARTEIKPLDKWKESSKTIDITAVASYLDNYSLKYFGKINVDLPDKLIGVVAKRSAQNVTGASSESGTFTGTGSYSVQQALRASAQSSATVLYDIIPVINQFWGSNIDCTHVHFFLPSPVEPADVLAKLTVLIGAVSTWPKFNPQTVTLVIRGGRISVQVSAASQGSYSISSSGTSSTSGGGTGYSREVGSSLRGMRISPTIHAALSIVGDPLAHTETVSATATAQAIGLGPLKTDTQSGSAGGDIYPTSIVATNGATDWPTTGFYLFRVDSQPYRFGYIQFHCVVVNAADFPSS